MAGSESPMNTNGEVHDLEKKQPPIQLSQEGAQNSASMSTTGSIDLGGESQAVDASTKAPEPGRSL